VAATLAGCSNLPVTIAPSTIPLQQGKYTVIGPATGEATGVSIIGIPVSGYRQAAIARDRAIAAAGGDALVNVAGDVLILDLGIVRIDWLTIEGDAVKVQKQ
jgi:hypothetical protein